MLGSRSQIKGGSHGIIIEDAPSQINRGRKRKEVRGKTGAFGKGSARRASWDTEEFRDVPHFREFRGDERVLGVRKPALLHQPQQQAPVPSERRTSKGNYELP